MDSSPNMEDGQVHLRIRVIRVRVKKLENVEYNNTHVLIMSLINDVTLFAFKL